jgi:hypothetical protein
LELIRLIDKQKANHRKQRKKELFEKFKKNTYKISEEM